MHSLSRSAHFTLPNRSFQQNVLAGTPAT
jgi:hypothetical protein